MQAQRFALLTHTAPGPVLTERTAQLAAAASGRGGGQGERCQMRISQRAQKALGDL